MPAGASLGHPAAILDKPGPIGQPVTYIEFFFAVRKKIGEKPSEERL